jgi:PncC family amidohydrolase
MRTYTDEKAVREHYRLLTELLIDRKLSISTMESITSGQIASLITDTEGASEIFPGGYVTYSNRAKVMAGVPEEIIGAYSVYSKETAEAMAVCCRKSFDTDIGIGITGTTGNPDPQNGKASVPGEVYFAIAARESVHSFFIHLPACPTRLMYKLAAAEEVYRELIKEVSKHKTAGKDTISS